MENPFDSIHTQVEMGLIDENLTKLEAMSDFPHLLKNLRENYNALRTQVAFLQDNKNRMEAKYKAVVNQQLESLDESRFWEQPILSRFSGSVFLNVPVAARPVTSQGYSTRFITMINLKGGVGKTTLTTNLASAFASGNYNNESGTPLKVLVVDLDFQGSLSSLCLTDETRQSSNIAASNKYERPTSSWLLREAPKQRGIDFQDLIFPSAIDGQSNNINVIAADEYLDEVDVQQIVAQVMGGRETRFEFRKYFHQPTVLNQYDLVIFDCPPRITPSSINAMLASDYVIIPTRLDKVNSDATGRTLTWLGRLQRSNLPGILPKLAGVIINFAPKNASQTFRSKLFYDLDDYVKEYQSDSNKKPDSFIFNAEISTTVNVSRPIDGGEKKRPLALKSLNLSQDPAQKIQIAFGEFATELFQRIYQ